MQIFWGDTNMNKKQDRINIAKKICLAAQIYKDNLVGKTFLYIFDNRYIEVVYRTKDFAHLTGVETKEFAKDFFKYALKSHLHYNQIHFTKRHPYDLSSKKVEQLINIQNAINTELIILETVTTKTATYKFGIADLEFTLCMDKDTDANGNAKSDYYIVKSLRAEDTVDKSKDAFEVHFVLMKDNDSKKYDTVTYADKRYSISDLPDNIQELININTNE